MLCKGSNTLGAFRLVVYSGREQGKGKSGCGALKERGRNYEGDRRGEKKES